MPHRIPLRNISDSPPAMNIYGYEIGDGDYELDMGQQLFATPNIALLGVVYIVLTFIGLVGNFIVIAMIVRVLLSRRMMINVYVYVLCLSAVDFVFLATAPMTISFMLNGDWIYGAALCKIAFVAEGLNKTMSSYLLAILSADRYLAVCRPTTSVRYRSIRAAVAALSISIVCILLTNIPIYKYATVTLKPTANNASVGTCGMHFPKLNESGSDADPWNHVGSYYTLVLVICYYIAPAGMICLFYLKILCQLSRRQRAFRSSSSGNRRRKVTMSVLAVVAFYFICWTPYWLLQMVIQFWPQLVTSSGASSATTSQSSSSSSSSVSASSSEDAQMDAIFTYVATSIYTLPYVNSSVDPVLYAFLNKRLRKAYAASSRTLMSRNVQRPSCVLRKNVLCFLAPNGGGESTKYVSSFSPNTDTVFDSAVDTRS